MVPADGRTDGRIAALLNALYFVEWAHIIIDQCVIRERRTKYRGRDRQTDRDRDGQEEIITVT